MVPMAVIVRMDLSSLLCAVPSYHYLPSTWRWIRYHRHVFLLLFLSLMNHPTCIVIIHRTICVPTEQIPTPSTPPSQNTLMHALSCLPSIHILEQVTPLSPTPQSRSTQDTHNNRLTYSHPLALDMISSMHYHVISSHPSASFIKSPLCHQPPSPDPHNIHTTIN